MQPLQDLHLASGNMESVKNVFVDGKRGPWLAHRDQRWLICAPPKTGCSSIRKYLIMSEICNASHIPSKACDRAVKNATTKGEIKLYGFKEVGQVFSPSMHELRSLWKNASWTKVALTKHPWLRLLSSFRAKWLGIAKRDPSYFRRHYQLDLRKEDPRNVTFGTFLTYLLTVPMEKRDRHFRATHSICGHGFVRYDRVVDLMINPEDLPFKYTHTFAELFQRFPQKIFPEMKVFSAKQVEQVKMQYLADYGFNSWARHSLNIFYAAEKNATS